MLHVPAVIVGSLVAAAKASAAVKVVAAASASVLIVAPVMVLNYKTVEQSARQQWPAEKVAVKRTREKNYIRIEIEGHGKGAVWLTERLDELMEKLLPTDGATATI